MSEFRMRDQFPTLRRIPGGICRAFKRMGEWVGRTFIRTWKFALVVFVLLVVAHGAATLVIGRKLDAELARIKASGDPVSAAELAGLSMPDDVNGAVVYERAFRQIKPECSDRPPEPWGGLDFLIADNRENPQMWAKAPKAIQDNADALSIVEKAAAMPECRFKTNWKDGYNAQFPYLGRLRYLANLISLRAVMQAKDGDMVGSAKSIELILKMSYGPKDDPILISQIFRQFIIKRAAMALQAAMDHGQFSDAQAHSLADAFSKIDLGPGFVTAMKGERVMTIAVLLDIRRHGYWDNESLAQRAYWSLYTSYVGKPLLTYHQLLSLRFMRKQISLCGLTYREVRHLDLAWMDQTNAGPLTPMICPIDTSARGSVDNAMMYARGSQIILALQSYKHHFAKYPASLTELKAKIRWDLKTEDIFSGEDFIYRPGRKGVILHSIGRNRKDDGGVGPQLGGYSTNDPDDIVWKMNR